MKNEFDEKCGIAHFIPYGRYNTSIVVLRNGKVRIKGQKTSWILDNIFDAIRQQYIHVWGHYVDLVIKNVSQQGDLKKISKLLEIMRKDLKTLETYRVDIEKKKNINELVKRFIDNNAEINTELETILKQKIEIASSVLKRAENLYQEQQRCEKIINNTLDSWFQYYNFLLQGKVIPMREFYSTLKKLTTVWVNPYFERTHSKEIEKLKRFHTFLREEQQKYLWKSIEKLMPIYTKEIDIKLDGKRIIMKNGKIINK